MGARPATPPANVGATPHAHRKDTDELARRQGVGPVADLDTLSALWPAPADDADALEAFILGERTARRQLATPRS